MQKIAAWVLTNYTDIRDNLSTKTKNNEDLTFSVVNLLSEINSKGKNVLNEELETAVNAFVGIGENNYHPRLRFLDTKPLQSKSANDNPLAIVEDANEEEEMWTGYELDENGEPYQTDEEPTEENTQGRDFVIIELGDGTCDGGPQKCNDHGDGTTGGGNGGTGTSGNPKVLIEDIRIKDLKETWPGRAEIHFKGYWFNVLPNASGLCGELLTNGSACDDREGNRIERLRRSERNDNINTDFTIDSSDLPARANSNTAVIFYVIFEHDRFPSPTQTDVLPLPNGGTRKILYHSFNSEYDRAVVPINSNNPWNLQSVNGFSENNSDIEYNLIVD